MMDRVALLKAKIGWRLFQVVGYMIRKKLQWIGKPGSVEKP